MKKVKALYDETLEDDAHYVDYQEEAAKHREELKQKKSKILTKQDYITYEEQLKELKDDLKENREILSQELADYYKETGSLEITSPDGGKKRMKFNVKLVSTSE